MVTSGSKVDWEQSQDALRDEVAQVTTLLRSISDPVVPAVGQWNLGDVAMHLTQAWMIATGLARRDLSPVHAVVPSTVAVAGGSLVRDFWDLGEVMMVGVQADPERDLGVLADRIEAQAEKYFSECVGADPDESRPWLIEGTTVRLSTLTCNLLSETVIHTYDIAHAAGRKWRIEPAHAAIVLGRFIVPVLQAAGPRTFVNSAKADGLQATYDVRIRGGGSFHFAAGGS